MFLKLENTYVSIDIYKFDLFGFHLCQKKRVPATNYDIKL